MHSIIISKTWGHAVWILGLKVVGMFLNGTFLYHHYGLTWKQLLWLSDNRIQRYIRMFPQKLIKVTQTTMAWWWSQRSCLIITRSRDWFRLNIKLNECRVSPKRNSDLFSFLQNILWSVVPSKTTGTNDLTLKNIGFKIKTRTWDEDAAFSAFIWRYFHLDVRSWNND